MTRIQLRHDTATNWTTANPILAEGEVGVETDTNKMKIGDGTTTWNSLDYQGNNIDLSNYYTKSETDTLLLDKEDNITPVAPMSLEKKSISNLDGFTYATETTIVPNTYVGYSFTSSNGYPVDTYNNNHLSSSYILMPFHNSYIYKVPLDQISSTTNAIMFGYFDENGVWVPVMQVKGTSNNQTFYYGPSSVFSYSNHTFQTTNAQSYNQATASNTASVTAEDAQVIDGFTNAIQLQIADSASDGYICTVGMLTYTSQAKTTFRAQTMVWDSSSRADDITHLKKITHIAILPVTTTMPFSTYYSTTSFGMYEHNERIFWSPEAFISLIKSKENLYDLAGSSAQNYLELNLGDGLTVTNNLLTTTMNANDYYTKTQADTLLNNKVDLNFNNMNPSQTAKDTIIGWGMPDFSSMITIPYDTSIQLPCDAVVYHEDYSDTYTDYCKTSISLDGTNWVTIGNWGWTCMASSYTILPKGIYVKCTGKNSSFYTAWYAPLKGAN